MKKRRLICQTIFTPTNTTAADGNEVLFLSNELDFHYFHGKTNKICLHFVKFLLKLTATGKILRKPFVVLESNLVFSMFRFFLLNIDWNPKN